MAAVIANPVQLLESSMFNQVLNIYVANDPAKFAAAALSLLAADRFCDFCVALLRRPASGSFVAYDSRRRSWDSQFVQLHAAILGSIRDQIGSEQKLLTTDSSDPVPANGNLERYRCEVLEKLGSCHAALLFFGERNEPPSLLISVHRTRSGQEFAPPEHARLEAFRRYIENAWSLLSQRLLSRLVVEGISLAVRNYELGVVMLDSRLHVVWHNRAARTSILAWNDEGQGELKPGRHLGPLPPDILAACERLRDEWLEAPSASRLRKKSCVRHRTVPGRSATIRMCGARVAALPGFIVEFEEAVGAVPPNPTLRHSLTSSEREVARLVCQGMSNQEIADTLGKSVEAVKFHLHRMFKKAEVTTRSRLMLALT